MNTITNQINTGTEVFTGRWLRRASSAAAIVAVVAAAIGVPVMSPEPISGTGPVLAIARADCPPDCGGGPGNGGTPSGPPGGGTEFVPPSVPAMPSYDPVRGQPPLDQSNGISIYNSAAPQPSQAAPPSQQPVQNQDGTYNRAANGEQQPINYNNAPNNQGIDQDWQNLSNRLNQQPQGQSGQQQSGQDKPQTDQTQNKQQDTDQTCESIVASLSQRFPDLFEYTEEELAEARQKQEDINQQNEENQRNGQSPVALPRVGAYFSQEHIDLIVQYNTELAAAEEVAGLAGQCIESNGSGATPAASEVEPENVVRANDQFGDRTPSEGRPNPDPGQSGKCWGFQPPGLPEPADIKWPNISDPPIPSDVPQPGTLSPSDGPLYQQVGGLAVAYMKANGMDVSSFLLAHYLDNLGTEIVLDPEVTGQFLSDTHNAELDAGKEDSFPSAATALDNTRADLIEKAFKLPACMGVMFVDSGWVRVTAGSDDHHNALGHYYIRVVLAVDTNNLGGSSPSISFVRNTQLYDDYTFQDLELSISTELPFKLVNNYMRKLAQMRLAKDFIVRGSLPVEGVTEIQRMIPIPIGG